MDTLRDNIPLEHLDAYRWCILQSYQPGMISADDVLIEAIQQENAAVSSQCRGTTR